jgi:hypothetical protein
MRCRGDTNFDRSKSGSWKCVRVHSGSPSCETFPPRKCMPPEIEEQIACPRGRSDDDREVQNLRGASRHEKRNTYPHARTIAVLHRSRRRFPSIALARFARATLGTLSVPAGSSSEHAQCTCGTAFAWRLWSHVRRSSQPSFCTKSVDISLSLRQPFRFVTVNPQLRRDSFPRTPPNSGGVAATCPT